jgi:DNA repair photolyase
MATTKSVIYETGGRAREYNELAINLFDGCGHRCEYCYAWLIAHKKKDQFFAKPKARLTPGDIQVGVFRWKKDHPDETRPVLLCFTCDPYQPIEAETKLTRQTIEILHSVGLRVTILTKAGLRAVRDFDHLGPGDAFATTLTCTDNHDSEEWEPGAALPGERIASLYGAARLGVETWVSLEPVLFPEDTKVLVQMTKGFVAHYKVGMLNYHKHADTIDWKAFGWDIKEFLDKLGVKYMIKKDLLYAMGVKEAGGSTGPAGIGFTGPAPHFGANKAAKAKNG